MELATKVRARREELGLSQDELAKRMGYKSRTSINKIENGRPVSQKIIVSLADALGVTAAYLMGWEENPEQKEKLTVNDDELSEDLLKLLDFVKCVPEEKAAMILQVMKTIVEAD
jgi:transcriptional regulator with XRE-family HTH domain